MDVEKTIQFLLDQQARSDARQARLEEWQTRFAREFADDMSKINGVLVELATAQERTNRIVAVLAEKVVDLTESHKALTESHNALAKAHKATEETLNVLISTVERHLSDHE
jgi:hypothetical protein